MERIRTPVITESDLQVIELEDGQLEVRETLVNEAGDKYYHRYVVHPGMATADKDPRVDTLAKRVHTSKVVADFWETRREHQIDA